ncbi:MAG TPA: nitroreductase family deazaflavin-dependent oxidoreductase [Acidimicrobiales bacterium]|jgi:deazaflavin-dependent oxidoreductase (nitroreductase family)|nr:nitroreductase family deazaflavin-dependent oxidoreductase [Acidimicrobiales bacterium]
MAYLKPGTVTRKLFNPLAARIGLYGTAALTVAGRRTGQPCRVPVIPFEHQAGRYVVSTRGESEWVRNLRAAGEGQLERRGQVTRFRAVEIPVAERPPIIAAYRQAAGREVNGYFKSLPDPADHPTFLLDPIG